MVKRNLKSSFPDTARYLGVDISSNLNFKQHINRIISNVNRILGFLTGNTRVKNPGVREAAYQTVKATSRVCFNGMEPIYNTRHQQS